MTLRTGLAALLAIGLLTVGCIGTTAEDTSAKIPEQAFHVEDPGTGVRLVIEVVNLTRAPLVGADVTLLDQEPRVQETGPLGQVVFDHVEGSQAKLDIRAPDHHPRRVTVSLPDDGEARETVLLSPVSANTTTVQRYAFEGFFECSATYLIVTGDCLTLARAGAQRAGIDPPEGATNQRFAFPFEAGAGWTRIDITQTWQEPVASLGSMMRVNLEPIEQNNTEGHGQRYARSEGPSPVHLTVHNDGTPHANASAEEMVVPEDGALLRTRTFHLGFQETHNPAGTPFLGLGASIQQQFKVYVNVTYGG